MSRVISTDHPKQVATVLLAHAATLALDPAVVQTSWGGAMEFVVPDALATAAEADLLALHTGSPFAAVAIAEPIEDAAPVITSAAAVSFAAGVPGTFTVTATGTPAPALTRTGALPAGVTFVDNLNGTATLAGTPGGAPAAYPLVITADNELGPAVTQNFVLTVAA